MFILFAIGIYDCYDFIAVLPPDCICSVYTLHNLAMTADLSHNERFCVSKVISLVLVYTCN
jgi:hypothetical protein